MWQRGSTSILFKVGLVVGGLSMAFGLWVLLTSHLTRQLSGMSKGPGVDNAIEKYLVPSRELLAVLQLWRASQQIIFRYDVIPGSKVLKPRSTGSGSRCTTIQC
jgi:hypothetical protein